MQETLILTSGLTVIVGTIMCLIFKTMIKSAIVTLIQEERLKDISKQKELQIEKEKKITFDSSFSYVSPLSFKVSNTAPTQKTILSPVKPIPKPNLVGKVSKIKEEQKHILNLSISETGFVPSANGEIKVELTLFTIDHLKKAFLIEILNDSLFLNGNYERIIEIDKCDLDSLILLSNEYIKQTSKKSFSSSLESIRCHSCHEVSNSTEWNYKNENDISCPECGADL